MSLAAGFFGKIPTRGDFVRHGLPPDFVRALDSWWQAVLPDSRARLGETWTDAWMEAPVWRFALAPGICGACAAVGLWVPSTDKAGRLFPLTIAVAAPKWRDLAAATPFLDAAETIAIAAVERDVEPEQLADAIQAACAQAGTPMPEPLAGTGRWWTEGSPRVAPVSRDYSEMPDGRAFGAMLRDA